MSEDQAVPIYEVKNERKEDGVGLTVTTYDLPGAELVSVTGLFENPREWYDALIEEIPFRQEKSFVHGKLYDQPRLTCLLGTHSYSYSGKKRIPFPWGPNALAVRDYVQDVTRDLQPERAAKFPEAFTYHSAISNYYTNGNDHIGHHADKAPELIPEAYIGSLTLLEEEKDVRPFDLFQQVRDEKTGRLKKGPRVLRLELRSGELLLMGPGCQEHFYHELAPRKKIKTGRLNLTFRALHPWAQVKDT